MDKQKNSNTDIDMLSQGFVEIRLSLIEYAMTHTLDEFLTHTLDEVGAFLDSPIGFYHFVEPNQKTLSMQQWSTRTLKGFCRAAEKGTHYTVDPAGVWADCLRQKKAVIHNDYSSLPQEKGLPEGHAEVVRELVVPVIRKNKVVAILGVGNKPTHYIQKDVDVVSYLADVTWEIVNQKRTYEALRSTTIDLHERVKELSCLYNISRMAEEDLTTDEFIQKTIEFIPPAWQYPEMTCAQIKLNNRLYRTKPFIKTKWVQSREIRVNSANIGVLEVYLSENSPEQTESPFLKEEINLIKAIAERLGHIIGHKLADEALQKAHDELQIRVEERTRELVIQNQHLLNEIREREKVEEELLRNSEKINLFAYSVVHDLKNPAIATQGLARILREKYGETLTDRGKEICEQIQQSSEDIASLVDKINKFITTKETPVNIGEVSLKEVFQVLHKEFFSQLNIRGIQWMIQSDLPDILVADRLSIVRIFRNIIENSFKYGGNELTRIEIGYRSTDDLHILTVTDDGQGLTVENSDNIFDWFKRQTTSTEIHGTGMGLAIVKEIAALHGGDVWQEPAKSKGVTFCVSLSRHLIPNTEDGVQA